MIMDLLDPLLLNSTSNIPKQKFFVLNITKYILLPLGSVTEYMRVLERMLEYFRQYQLIFINRVHVKSYSNLLTSSIKLFLNQSLTSLTQNIAFLLIITYHISQCYYLILKFLAERNHSTEKMFEFSIPIMSMTHDFWEVIASATCLGSNQFHNKPV